MDMNDLRAEALRQASIDCRSEHFQGSPEMVVSRAKTYLAFLLGTAPAPKPTTRRKKARS